MKVRRIREPRRTKSIPRHVCHTIMLHSTCLREIDDDKDCSLYMFCSVQDFHKPTATGTDGTGRTRFLLATNIT